MTDFCTPCSNSPARNTFPPPSKVSSLLDDPALQQEPWCIPPDIIESLQTGDVLLVCKGQRAVQCHSQVLALCSEVLHHMLEACDVCKGCRPDQPALVHLSEDEAEHWMFALMFVYPNVVQTPPVTLDNSMALALLGHKYNVHKMLAAWDKFVSLVSERDANLGHFVWNIPYWGLAKESFVSKTFEAGGHKWNLQVYPDGFGEGKNSCMSLFLNKSSSEACELVDACFQLVMVSHGRLTDAVVTDKLQRAFDNRKGWGWARFVSLDVFHDARKEFVKHDRVEIQVVVKVHYPSHHVPGQHVLSGEVGSVGYVFKWLELARRVEDAVLERKCLSFMGTHAFYAVLDARFRQDMRDAMAHVGPDQLITLMREARKHL